MWRIQADITRCLWYVTWCSSADKHRNSFVFITDRKQVNLSSLQKQTSNGREETLIWTRWNYLSIYSAVVLHYLQKKVKLFTTVFTTIITIAAASSRVKVPLAVQFLLAPEPQRQRWVKVSFQISPGITPGLSPLSKILLNPGFLTGTSNQTQVHLSLLKVLL